MKPFAAFIDVHYLGFYGIINNGGDADTHPLNTVCAALPTLCGFSNLPRDVIAQTPQHTSEGQKVMLPSRKAKTLFLFTCSNV